MKTVKCGSTFGNFQWTGHAEVTDEQAEILQNLGALQVMQRSPSSRAEKTLGKYEKRPDNFKRNSIEFSEANAKTLASELSKPVEIADGVEISFTIDEVKFYEIGKGTEPKYVEEKAIIARHVKDGDFLDWLRETVGFSDDFDGNHPTEDTKVLAAVKAYKQRRLAEV
jgi:hypothetical protein